MIYDPKTKTFKPNQTNVERIKQLEGAMERIASNKLTVAECVTLAVSLRRTDNRKWRKDSPRSHSKMAAALAEV